MGIWVETAAEMLETEADALTPVLESLGQGGALVIESANMTENLASAEGKRVYARPLYAAECEVARRLAALICTPRDEARLEAAMRGQGAPGNTTKERLGHLARRALEGGKATGNQGAAIEGALTHKSAHRHGRPRHRQDDHRKRRHQPLYETRPPGHPGRAHGPGGQAPLGSHRPRGGHHPQNCWRIAGTRAALPRDAENPLAGDIVIIDEASMLDVHLTAHLLRAVPDAATLVLVGDVDQLPSVGPGNVLSDAITSETLPVVRLTEVFRQAQESLIVENAHRVNRGEMPRNGKGEKEDAPFDYYFIEESEAERCADLIIELCRERIPERFGIDAIADLQVISPMQRGVLGVQSLNARLQEALNPAGNAPALQSGGRTFRTGDKLIQVRNNYEKDVFNGDIGVVKSVAPEEGSYSRGLPIRTSSNTRAARSMR